MVRTALIVLLAAALSSLTPARAGTASLRRRHLPHAGAGGGRQRAARGVLHAPHLAGEPLRPGGGQPGGSARHRAVHAADRRDARPRQRVRAAARRCAKSASYLRELRTTFRGNLGLAAAAYNAGPGQVEAWLAGRRRLPFETQAYVRIITGYAAEAWASPTPPQLPPSSHVALNAATGARCVELAKLLIDRPQRRRDLTSDPAWGPWGVQLAGTWSEGRVLATYEQLRRRYDAVLGERLPLVLDAQRRAPSRFIVRVSESSRKEADALWRSSRPRVALVSSSATRVTSCRLPDQACPARVEAYTSRINLADKQRVYQGGTKWLVLRVASS